MNHVRNKPAPKPSETWYCASDAATGKEIVLSSNLNLVYAEVKERIFNGESIVFKKVVK